MVHIPITIPARLESCRSQAHKEFIGAASEAGIPGTIQQDYFDAIFATAAWVTEKADRERPFALGIAGAQGSGKSTLATLLSAMLGSAFHMPACVLALDDFYKTRAARQQLAHDIHPLLQVRGVPGTHDMALMRTAISNLEAGLETRIPQFDKARDDRVGYRLVSDMPQVLIMEGWCWGARPASSDELAEPINELEAEQDPDGRWRAYVNDRLADEEYQGAFRSVDKLVYLVVPDMEAVYRWRLQQEQALGAEGGHVMSEAQINEFIMYYERITRRMLADLPERADIAMYLDDAHAIDAFRVHDE